MIEPLMIEPLMIEPLMIEPLMIDSQNQPRNDATNNG
jgi:hypothetical protein